VAGQAGNKYRADRVLELSRIEARSRRLKRLPYSVISGALKATRCGRCVARKLVIRLAMNATLFIHSISEVFFLECPLDKGYPFCCAVRPGNLSWWIRYIHTAPKHL
jgi:hypothetical protein